MPTELWIPEHLRGGQKTIAIVFYVNPTTGWITVGFPDQFPAPKGLKKVVCRTAAEVDLWDQKMRDQDRFHEEKTEEERELVEGPMRDAARKELQHLMANARNTFNREFCRFAIERLDAEIAKRKKRKESFMHIAAFEDGK